MAPVLQSGVWFTGGTPDQSAGEGHHWDRVSEILWLNEIHPDAKIVPTGAPDCTPYTVTDTLEPSCTIVVRSGVNCVQYYDWDCGALKQELQNKQSPLIFDWRDMDGRIRRQGLINGSGAGPISKGSG